MPLSRSILIGALTATVLSGCARSDVDRPVLPPASYVATKETPGEEYVIGPLDQLQIFVWRNPELSSKVQVRPDGRSRHDFTPQHKPAEKVLAAWYGK